MAAAAILDFVGYQLLEKHDMIWTHIFGLCVEFGVNPFKNDWVIVI